jgi:hypothetical protein
MIRNWKDAFNFLVSPRHTRCYRTGFWTISWAVGLESIKWSVPTRFGTRQHLSASASSEYAVPVVSSICLVILVMLESSTAQAQTWRPVVRECAAEINRQAGCASCGTMWPFWMRCAVPRLYGNQVSSATLESCLQKVWDRRLVEHDCAMCGDPAADVISCIGG